MRQNNTREGEEGMTEKTRDRERKLCFDEEEKRREETRRQKQMSPSYFICHFTEVTSITTCFQEESTSAILFLFLMHSLWVLSCKQSLWSQKSMSVATTTNELHTKEPLTSSLIPLIHDRFAYTRIIIIFNRSGNQMMMTGQRMDHTFHFQDLQLYPVHPFD